MKKHLLTYLLLIILRTGYSQNVSGQKPPSQVEIDKMMEESMQGMDETEKEEMKAMMKNLMPTLTETASVSATYPEFNDNRELVPKKEGARLSSITSRPLVAGEVASYASTLYAKIMAKGTPEAVGLIKSVVAKSTKASDVAAASVLAMTQGHPQAALGLSMKAVQMEPSNPNWQNNMAALLSQYGYPEQAIPVLSGLKSAYPYNSTVLNNLGHAWFALGVLDSAKINTNLAMRVNPNHPEAAQCAGIVEEVTGDPVKAIDDYEQAMENAPNPMIEKILINKSGGKGLEKIDFEKLKQSITIYEYFPKNWIGIPTMSDDVSGFENDMRVHNGYAQMIEALRTKLEANTEAAAEDINVLTNKGEDAFIMEMAKENMKGYNSMSKTAVLVMKIIMNEMAKVEKEWGLALKDMNAKIEAKRIAIEQSRNNNDKCADFDRQNNELLSFANPLIRDHYTKHIEEIRVLLNAYCTWAWYITGNPKNAVMIQCLGMTEVLVGLYEDSVMEQQQTAKSCVEQDGSGSNAVSLPEIPNFSCPTIVRIPLGSDWQQISNAVNNFDDNGLGMKKNTTNPVPNTTVSYSSDSSMISQPGEAPFVKTTEGNVAPGKMNDFGEDLAPLAQIPLERLTPIPDLRRHKALKDLMNNLMTTNCDNVKSMEENSKARWDKVMKMIEKMESEIETKKELAEIRKNGLHPTINSGIQAPNTFTPTKGLFN